MRDGWLTIARYCGTALLLSVVCLLWGLLFSLARDGEKIAAVLIMIGICAAVAAATFGAILGLHLIWR